jgi:hypothetical protein
LESPAQSFLEEDSEDELEDELEEDELSLLDEAFGSLSPDLDPAGGRLAPEGERWSVA